MKSTTIACAIAAAILSFGSLASAQDHSRRGDVRQADEQGNIQRHGHEQHGERHGYDHRDERRDRQYGARHDRRYEGQTHGAYDQRDHRSYSEYNGRDHRRFGGHGAHFQRGGYIPSQYRSQRYYVNDWHHHRLSAPPYGHQWVQVGSDYALIALASGVIAHLLINQ